MRMALVALAVVLAACHQGNGLGGPPVEDMAQIEDLTPPPDLLPGPTCGKIVACVLGCGMMNLLCLPGCVQNAPPMAQQQAFTLVACAAQNCLQGGAGGNMFQIFQCLAQKCPTEVQGCQGLFGL